jgi:uncharacterized protein YcbX
MLVNMSEIIATVAELFVYPIKSMAGVSVQEAYVGLDGILGDRQYSFVRSDQAARNSFPWMTARQSAGMLLYKPRFTKPAAPDQPEPPVEVQTPEGAVCDATDPALCEELTRKMGHALFLLKSARGIFDCQHISVCSLASVLALSAEAGCAIDRRQFRANVYVQPVSGRAFDEETWTRGLLQVAGEALMGVTQRDTRCMMVNLDPESGDQNPRVLKTIAQGHQGQTGIYANVVRPGLIRVGDPIRLYRDPS